MIVFCDELQRKQALAMWKQIATPFDVTASEFRFHKDWLASDVIAYVHDFTMHAFMLEQSKTIRCKEHGIAIMYCPWVVKDEGPFAGSLLKARLKMHAHRYLATIIVSDDEVFMRTHHAKPWVVTQTITLSKNMIEPLSFAMVTFECPLEMVMQAYDAFSERFDGTVVRQVCDFELKTLATKVKRKRAGIIENDRLLGYIDYELTPYCLDIKECVYENIDTLLRLLSFAASMHHHIVIHASSVERFEKLFPQAVIGKKVESWIVLHHPALWSELFKQEITTIEDVLRVLPKPVMMHIK